DDFSHVWTTIYRVELVPASGAVEVVFDDPAGRVIDLKTLRDAGGARFAFLSHDNVAAATYTGAKVTVDGNMNLVPNGSVEGSGYPVSPSLPRDAQNHPILT